MHTHTDTYTHTHMHTPWNMSIELLVRSNKNVKVITVLTWSEHTQQTNECVCMCACVSCKLQYPHPILQLGSSKSSGLSDSSSLVPIELIEPSVFRLGKFPASRGSHLINNWQLPDSSAAAVAAGAVRPSQHAHLICSRFKEHDKFSPVCKLFIWWLNSHWPFANQKPHNLVGCLFYSAVPLICVCVYHFEKELTLAHTPTLREQNIRQQEMCLIFALQLKSVNWINKRFNWKELKEIERNDVKGK